MRALILASLFSAGLIACGDDGGKARDASVGSDGAHAADASAVDAAPQPVTLTVLEGSAAGSGVTVYFQNADSTLVAEKLTDGSGNASSVMAAGGFVTALLPVLSPGATTFTPTELRTFAGVKPGDHLYVQVITASTTGDDVIAPLDGTDNSYSSFQTCSTSMFGGFMAVGSGLADGEIDVLPSCATADIAIWASSSTAPAPAFDVAYASNVTLSATTDLRSNIGAYAAAPAFAVSISDFPASETGTVSVLPAAMTAQGPLYSPAITPTAITGTATGSGWLYVPTGTTKMLAVTEPSLQGIGAQQVYELSAAGSSYAIDLGASLVDRITATPTFSATTHTVTWTKSAELHAADTAVVRLDINRDPDEWTWELAAPHDTSIAFPTLPTDVFDYNAMATDEVELFELDTFKVPGGYDAFRSIVLENSVVDLASVLGTTVGQATMQKYEDEGSARSKRRRAR